MATNAKNIFIIGKNIYYDKKGRNIYYNPFLKKAYYIRSSDASKFTTYQYRVAVVVVLLFILLYSFAYRQAFNYYPFIISAIAFVLIELSFLSFLKKQEEYKRFNKDDLISQYDIDKKGYTDRLRGKILVGFGLAILVIYMGIRMKASTFVWIFYGAAAVCGVIYALIGLKELKTLK